MSAVDPGAGGRDALERTVLAALLPALMNEYGGDPGDWTAMRSLTRVVRQVVAALPSLATAGETVTEAVRAAYAEAVEASNALHLLHGNTTGCWGGIGGSAMTAECAMDCPNPKHEAAQEVWRNVCRKAQGMEARDDD